MLLIPHQPLIIEHSSELQKADISALISRCAKALDYEIVEQASVAADVGSDSTYATPRAAA